MKFSYQLAYNAFAPWSDQYVNYKKLKKLLKQQRRDGALRAESENWTEFLIDLAAEIAKFSHFFNETSVKLDNKLTALSGLKQDLKGRKSAIELFLEFSQLKKFIFLNAEGCRKLVKKFDKLNGALRSDEFLHSSFHEPIDQMLLEQREVDEKIESLLSLFARAFTDGDLDAANVLLSESLTDLVQWEKGTIWNDLLRLERNKSRIGTRTIASKEKIIFINEKNYFNFRFFANIFVLILSALAYCNLLLPALSLHASRCLSVLLLVSGWWSLGTFPLFVSALSVPLLVVVFDVIPGIDRSQASNLVLAHMWGGSQAMVLASFALAAALSKQRIDKQIACMIIAVIKTGKRKIMFALMFIGYASSFAIGNMAASVLSLSLAAPVLDELPQLDRATADFGKRLLVGIAFACNFGGMTSPVASPQNIVAFAAMQKFGLTFSQWVLVALPTSFSLFLTSFYVLAPAERPSHDLEIPLLVRASPRDTVPPRLRQNFIIDWKRLAVIFLVFFSAVLWMATNLTNAYFGDVGLASLLPLLLLFALPGVLNKSDFLSMPWDVSLLLASGGVLSLAVSESNLLSIAGASASSLLSPLPPFACTLISCIFVTVVSTGVSHTAAANVLMPFIVELGTGALGPSNALKFILPVSLCLSAGMALPVSSCPNINATAMSRSSDESVPWVKPSDYLKPGLLLSCFTVAVLVTVGDLFTSFVSP